MDNGKLMVILLFIIIVGISIGVYFHYKTDEPVPEPEPIEPETEKSQASVTKIIERPHVPPRKPVNTVCYAYLKAWRNMDWHERDLFAKKYLEEVTTAGCEWGPFERIRCENMPKEDGIASGCDPSVYARRCEDFQEYTDLGNSIRGYIHPTTYFAELQLRDNC